MNRIRLLSEQVANQIAAGEVVERPASVVKELVENALDAQARRISVEIVAGGRSLIRVTDDGLGMSRDDALLCLERHATSKIRLAEDLQSVQTLGFRGEALPSIASVSRFLLASRERESDSPEGTQVVVNGGRIVEVKAAGAAPGTFVEVRQLFFNLPARRKFMRSEETEASHVQHYLTLAALSFPGVAFTFQKDGRLVWQLAACSLGEPADALRERLRGLHGGELKLLRVDHLAELLTAVDEGQIEERSLGRLRVWGFIGAPGVSRATREDQHLFVNRRPVENRGLNFALLEGYHTALMKGRYPVCCLFLELDPSAVDVNIHPAKREVRFHREQDVRRAVAEAVRRALLDFHIGAKAGAGLAAAAASAGRALKAAAAPASPAAPTAIQTPSLFPAQTALPATRPAVSIPRPGSLSAPVMHGSEPSGTRVLAGSPGSSTAVPASDQGEPTPERETAIRPCAGAVALLDVPLRLVGVIADLYVVLESDRGMVLLDQHAAHERILFEQMLRRLEQGNAPSQRLLLPETVELSPRDAQFLREQLTVLNRLGVSVSEFGDRTFLLDALPPFVKAPDARRFVLELVDELKAAGDGVNSLRLGEYTVVKTVCRHAVKANDPLAGPELTNLVDDLRRCAMPYTCPHGRPTLIEMSLRELEKKFGRQQ